MYYQMIYRSRFRPVDAGASSTLRAIVSTSERNNARDRVTGYLVFDKAYFMQILEGDRPDVERIFQRIQQDPRHTELFTLYRGEVSERAFPEWSMGGAVRSPELHHIFARHGFINSLEDDADGSHFVALARDIADWEAQQQRAKGLSAR